MKPSPSEIRAALASDLLPRVRVAALGGASVYALAAVAGGLPESAPVLVGGGLVCIHLAPGDRLNPVRALGLALAAPFVLPFLLLAPALAERRGRR